MTVTMMPPGTMMPPRAVFLQPVGAGRPEPQPMPQGPRPFPPEMLFQFRGCVEDLTARRLTAILQQAMRAKFKLDFDPDVRTMCINGVQVIGIWFFAPPPPGSPAEMARNMGLARFGGLTPPENFFGFITTFALTRTLQEQFAKAPKRFNRRFQEDPNGDLVLTGIDVSFEAPNRIITRIDGFVDIPILPDIDFRVTSTDTVTVMNGQVLCQTQTSLNVRPGFTGFLAGLVGGLLLSVINPLFSLSAPVTAGLGAGVGGLFTGIPVDPRAGVGCQLFTSFPPSLPLPGGLFTIGFTRAFVDPNAIGVGGVLMSPQPPPLPSPRALVTFPGLQRL